MYKKHHSKALSSENYQRKNSQSTAGTYPNDCNLANFKPIDTNSIFQQTQAPKSTKSTFERDQRFFQKIFKTRTIIILIVNAKNQSILKVHHRLYFSITLWTLLTGRGNPSNSRKLTCQIKVHWNLGKLFKGKILRKDKSEWERSKVIWHTRNNRLTDKEKFCIVRE